MTKRKPPLFKIRSYVYDYILPDGRNAHKEFQIVVMYGQRYSVANVVKELIQSVPNVVPVSICELLVKDVSMQKLQENVRKRIYMPYTPIFLNKEEMNREASKHKKRS